MYNFAEKLQLYTRLKSLDHRTGTIYVGLEARF